MGVVGPWTGTAYVGPLFTPRVPAAQPVVLYTSRDIPAAITPGTVAATTTIPVAGSTFWQQTFESGTNGATITTANSDGAGTTPDSNPFTFVSIAATGTATYSTTAFRGALSGRFASGTSAGLVYGERLLGTNSAQPLYVRLRFQMPALPADATGIRPMVITDGVGAFQLDIRLNNAGKAALYTGAGSLVGLSTTVYAAGDWVDVGASLKTISASVGVSELVLFNAGGSIIETITSGPIDTVRGGGAQKLQVGMIRSGITSFAVLIDDVAISTAGYPQWPSAVGVTATPASVDTSTAITGPALWSDTSPAPGAVPAVSAVTGPAFTSDTTVAPGTVPAVTGVPAALGQVSRTSTPATVAAVAAVPGPAVRLSVLPTPGAVTAITAIGSATRTATVQLAATTVAATSSVPTPALASTAASTPGAITATTTIPTPTVATSAAGTAAPPTVAATTAVPPPVPAGSGSTAPTVVVAAAAVPSPVIRLGALPAPARVAAVAAIPAAGFVSTTKPTPTTVAGTTTIPGPAVLRTALATPTTIPTTSSIPPPVVGSENQALLGTVAATTSIPEVTVRLAAVAAPGAVGALAAIAAAQAITSVRLAPATIATSTIITGTASGRVGILPATLAAITTVSGTVRIGVSVPASTVTAWATIPDPRHSVGQVITATSTHEVGGQTQPHSLAAPGPAAALTNPALSATVGSSTPVPTSVTGDIPPGRVT